MYKIGLKCSDTVIFQNKDDMDEFVERKLLKNNYYYCNATTKAKAVNDDVIKYIEQFKFT